MVIEYARREEGTKQHYHLKHNISLTAFQPHFIYAVHAYAEVYSLLHTIIFQYEHKYSYSMVM